MLSVLQAVQLLRRKQKLRAPLRKLLVIAHDYEQKMAHYVFLLTLIPQIKSIDAIASKMK